MGIYIKDMAMPKSCRDCRFLDGEADTDYGVCAWCTVDGKARDAYTRQDCPLIPVSPHGRLIDENELLERARPVKNFDNPESLVVVLGAIKVFHTIIPADETEI